MSSKRAVSEQFVSASLSSDRTEAGRAHREGAVSTEVRAEMEITWTRRQTSRDVLP